MIANNSRDAHLFAHLGWGTAIGFLSGLYGLFLQANAVMSPFLKSTPYGAWVVDEFCGSLVIMVGGLLLTGFVMLFFVSSSVFGLQFLLQLSLYYLVLLRLLKNNWFHQYENAVYLKFVVCVTGMLLGGLII